MANNSYIHRPSSEITAATHDGRLRIAPFEPAQVNPSSYNIRLGPTLLTYTEPVLDTHCPQGAVDQDGNVLDILVQNRRDKAAARRFFRRLMRKTRAVPRVVVTDKLRSYGAAHARSCLRWSTALTRA